MCSCFFAFHRASDNKYGTDFSSPPNHPYVRAAWRARGSDNISCRGWPGVSRRSANASAVHPPWLPADRRSLLMLAILDKGSTPGRRPAREAAKNAEKCGKGNAGIFCGASIELRDGTIITGKNSPLMHASSSLILNATKHLAGIPDNIHLLPESIIDSITHLKKDILNGKMTSLDVNETLIALGISALSNPAAQLALEKLKLLRDCEVHLTHIPTPGDEAGLRKLKINLTCDPEYSSKSLFISG